MRSLEERISDYALFQARKHSILGRGDEYFYVERTINAMPQYDFLQAISLHIDDMFEDFKNELNLQQDDLR